MQYFEELFLAMVPQEPNPKLWPEYLRDDPIRGHGMFCFSSGFQLGLMLAVEVYRQPDIT